MSKKGKRSKFLVIKDEIPLIQSLRNYFSIPNFENLTFSENIITSESLPISEIFRDLRDKVDYNPKGKKSILWINPRPGITYGLLSDTILDFIILEYAPTETKQFLIRKRKSKYYLLKGWKPKTQSNYCEPLYIKETSIDDENYLEKLIQPRVYYRNNEEQYESVEIEYFLPFRFIQHHVGSRVLSHGRRIEKQKLVEWGYLLEEEGSFILTEKSKELLHQLQNLFFLEWWRGYFLNEEINENFIKGQKKRFVNYSEEIILRAYIDSILITNRISIQKEFSGISKLLGIDQKKIINFIENWMIGEYYGKECIYDESFKFPPEIIDRFWAPWTIIKKRYHNSLVFLDRQEERENFNHLLKSDNRVIIVKGDFGVGKTRFLSEIAEENSVKYDIYWLLLNKDISWDAIKQISGKEKGLVLIIDDTNKFENWELILEEFIQLEISSKKIKLVIVSPLDMEIDIFVQKHFKYRNEEIVSQIELNPLDFTDTKLKNKLTRLFLEYNLDINSLEPLLLYSEGYPEVIEHEFRNFINKKGEEKPDLIETISQFDQRIVNSWNNKLNDEEKEFLLRLSIIGDIHYNQSITPEISNELSENIIKNLIKNEWIVLHNARLYIKRIAYRNWIVKMQWLKKPEMKLKLNKFIEDVLIDNPIQFLKVLTFLYKFLNYVDFKKILNKVKTWGNCKNYEENNNQLLVIYKLIPFFALSFMQNQLVMRNAPGSAKKENDSSLSQDIPDTIKSLIKRLSTNWQTYINKVEIPKLFRSFNFLRYLLFIIQDYNTVIDICDGLLEVAKKEEDKTNVNLKFILNELYLYKCTIEMLVNPNNAKEIIKKYLKYEDVDKSHKGRLYTFLLDIYLKSKEKDFKKILSIVLKASDLYASSNNRVQFIYHWAYFFPFLKELFGNKSIFLEIHKGEEDTLNTIKQKIDIAKDWSKELWMTRQYISFELNWIIFNDSSNFQENIKKLNNLSKYALNNEEIYLTGDIFHHIGLEYFKNEYNEEAIDSFKKSIKYTKKSRVMHRISHTYFYLGDTYWRLAKFDEARKYHKKAYKQYKWEGDKSKALSCLNTLYDIDISTGQYDSAVKNGEEILFLSSELKDSNYYYDAVVRVAEANYLCQNFIEAERRLKEVGSKLDSLKPFLEKDRPSHINLLKILIRFKRKRKVDKEIFNQLSNSLQNYNFLINSFEFYWIIWLVEVLYSQEKKDWINIIVDKLKSNSSILDNPLSLYETILNYLDKFFKVSGIESLKWPQWANYFLDKLEKPDEFMDIKSNTIESFRNIMDKDTDDNINDFINYVKEIIDVNNSPEKEKILSIAMKISTIFPLLISKKLENKEIILQLFNILKVISNLFSSQEGLLKKIEFKKTPFSLLNITMILADNSIRIDQLELTEEIVSFAKESIITHGNSKEQLEILKRLDDLEEKRGNIKKALIYLEKIQKILETTGTDEERFATKLKRLNLSLFHSFNEKVEKEIFEWDENSPSLPIKIKNYIRELKIFTFLKKKQFDKAQSNAVLLISDRDAKKDIQFLLLFISGFINTVKIHEKLTDKLINNKLVDKYLFLLENVENDAFFINSFEHADALVALTNDFLKKIEQGKEISDSLKRWERVIKILSYNNQVKFQSYLQDLLQYLFKIYLDKTKDNNFENVNPEIITFLFVISHNYNLINIAMPALIFIIIEAYIFKKKEEFLKWVKIYFQLDYHLKYDEYSKLPEYIKNPPFFIKIGEDLGIEIDKDNSIEIYEFNSAFFILFSTVFLFDLFQKMDYDKWSDSMIIIWLKSLDILKFGVLRKQDNQILTGIWQFLIIEFDIVLSRLCRTSLQTDDYKTFYNTVLKFKTLNGWEGILGDIWVISIGLNDQDVPTRKNRFRQLKTQLLEQIPNSLKEGILEQLILLENLISPYKKPYEIAIKNDAEFSKLEYLKLIETNEINAQIENIFNIINNLSILEDFKGTFEWIKIGKELFTANGRNVELLILQLYEGIVYYRQGNLRDAKEKFKYLRSKWRNLKINDFFISTLLHYQIELRQGQDLEQCLESLNRELYRFFKVANKKEKQYFLKVLLGQMLTEIEPQFYKEIIKYFVKNHKIIISQYNLTLDSYKTLIRHYKLGFCVKIKKEKLFLKEYEKFYDENTYEAIQLFYDGPFIKWIDYLLPEEREEFNKNLLEFLLKFFKRKEPIKKIKINITETFKEEIIKQNLQLPPKTLHFIPHNLVRLHPEYFEYSTEP